MKHFILIIFWGSLFLSEYTKAQFKDNSANWWQFGDSAGLDFSSGTAVPIQSSFNRLGITIEGEGGASISDKSGNLLFYTNGFAVWDKTGQRMANTFGGAGIGGHPSSSSVAATNVPGEDSLFYIFCTNQGNFGIKYSIIDMKLNGGLGDAVSKNILVPGSLGTSERLCIIDHCDGLNYWLIATKTNTDTILAFKVTADTIEAPIISGTVGMGGGQKFAFPGTIKSSPDGSRIAIASWNFGAQGDSTRHTCGLYNFNKSTGVISNPITWFELGPPGNVANPNAITYGCSFSSNGQNVFFSEIGFSNINSNGYVHGYSLINYNKNDILASRRVFLDGIRSMGGIQLGPDGKIYVAFKGFLSRQMGLILNPNAPITNVIDSVLANNFLFPGNFSGNSPGLTQFNERVFYQAPDYQVEPEEFCAKQATQFSIAVSGGIQIDSVKWDFGDLSAGASNITTSHGPDTSFLYNNNGTYYVMAVIYHACMADTIMDSISIISEPEAIALKDTAICFGESVQLYGSGGIIYDWTPGESLDFIVQNPIATPKSTTEYILKVTDSITGCIDFDTITITVNTPNSYDIIEEDSIITKITETQLIATGAGPFAWSPAESLNDSSIFNPIASPDNNTIYKVETTDSNGCLISDSVLLFFIRDFFMPNAFSINSDKINDVIKPLIYDAQSLYFAIYDNKGSKVFETNEIGVGWNTKEGNDFKVETGVYAYHLKMISTEGEMIEQKGNITLVK